MKIHRDTLLYSLLLLVIMASQAFSIPFEKREPHDEKAVIVPKGARPMLKEEHPRRQLIVERIKARHKPALIIPFVRSWNTAALTALRGIEVEETPEFEPNDFELGFALHSQRMRVGALRNREYFQRETEGFPEGWYRPLDKLSRFEDSKGYLATTFMHLAAKRMRRNYLGYRDFRDRIGGILNGAMSKNKQVTVMAYRDMLEFKSIDTEIQPRVRNSAGISYRKPGEKVNRLELSGDSTWSILTDAAQRDLRYIAGTGTAIWGRSLNSDVDMDLKGKFQVSTLRDNTASSGDEVLNVRKSCWLEALGTISMAEHLQLRLNLSALYDSEYEFFFTPSAELAFPWDSVEIAAGIRKRAILPDFDEIYWPSKFVKVNDDLQPESFWEGFGSLKIDIITRLKFLVRGFYSRPESRITWNQLPGYVWEPKNVDTADSIIGEGSLVLNLVSSLDIFASGRYQRFDEQLFDPEIVATGGLSYGNPISGSIKLGASYWQFQTLEDVDSPENYLLAYGSIHKTIRRAVSIFIDGRYTFNNEAIQYYRGIPQAGRIVSVGVSVVFGGLE